MRNCLEVKEDLLWAITNETEDAKRSVFALIEALAVAMGFKGMTELVSKRIINIDTVTIDTTAIHDRILGLTDGCIQKNIDMISAVLDTVNDLDAVTGLIYGHVKEIKDYVNEAGKQQAERDKRVEEYKIKIQAEAELIKEGKLDPAGMVGELNKAVARAAQAAGLDGTCACDTKRDSDDEEDEPEDDGKGPTFKASKI